MAIDPPAILKVLAADLQGVAIEVIKQLLLADLTSILQIPAEQVASITIDNSNPSTFVIKVQFIDSNDKTAQQASSELIAAANDPSSAYHGKERFVTQYAAITPSSTAASSADTTSSTYMSSTATPTSDGGQYSSSSPYVKPVVGFMLSILLFVM